MTQGVKSQARAQGAHHPLDAVSLFAGLGGLDGVFFDDTLPSATPPAQPPAAPPPATPTSAPDDLAGLLGRHGTLENVARALLADNHRIREQRRQLRTQVPPEGGVVLTPEQAQAWTAYRQLDENPTTLRERLQSGTAAAERESARELASVSGANADVLQDRLRATGLRAEVRETPGQNGQAASRAVHVLNAEGQDLGELRAYATANWAPFVPALYPQAATTAPIGTIITPQPGPTVNPQPKDLLRIKAESGEYAI